jgi:hypothetical protein
MFNPERLLGGLMRSGVRRSGGMGSLISGGVAMGMLGVAMEAVEHFMNKGQTGIGPSSATVGGSAPPMPPSSGSPIGGGPPPPPSGQRATPPPVPGPLPAETQREAVLLIQAMIAAANADGAIDAQERARILGKLKSVSLSEEDHQFIMHELLEPKDVRTISTGVTSPEIAHQVYLVSLMAIEVDTDAERLYLKDLARHLGLSSDQVAEIHRQVGLSQKSVSLSEA